MASPCPPRSSDRRGSTVFLGKPTVASGGFITMMIRNPGAKSAMSATLFDEERAALAYNEAVIAADLADIRKMNRVDASGRPLPKDQD